MSLFDDYDKNSINSAYTLARLHENLQRANEVLKQEKENEPNVLALKEINKTIEAQNAIIEKQRRELEEERKQRAIADKKNKNLTILFTVLNLAISVTAIIVSIVLHFVG